MKITAKTTLAELAMLRAKYGVVQLTIVIDHEMMMPVLAIAATPDFSSYGRGQTEIEALDDVFARLEHRSADGVREHDAPPIEKGILRRG